MASVSTQMSQLPPRSEPDTAPAEIARAGQAVQREAAWLDAIAKSLTAAK